MINTSPVLVLEFEDSEVVNGITYQYHVTALYDEGESGASNTADATPYDLNTPQNLTATASIGLVELEWEEPEPQGLALIGYNVYRDDIIMNQNIVTELEYEDSEVVNGTTYQYYITALYDEGESDPSNTVEATPEEPITLASPENVTISIDNGEVTVSWDSVLNANYYVIEATDDITSVFVDISSERGYFSEDGDRVSWTMQMEENEQRLFFRVKAAY
jgi:hypothetical protein